jgi:hypothetical protein
MTASATALDKENAINSSMLASDGPAKPTVVRVYRFSGDFAS